MTTATAKSLERWHEAVRAGDVGLVRDIVHGDAVFKSPAVFKPYEGREALLFVLRAAYETLKAFAYKRTFFTEDGTGVVLEFSAKVGGREVDGADFIQFDAQGLIREFKVMIRPMSALHAVAEAMAAQLERQAAKL